MLLEALARLAPEIGGAKEDEMDVKAVPPELGGDAAGTDAIDIVGEADQGDGGCCGRKAPLPPNFIRVTGG